MINYVAAPPETKGYLGNTFSNSSKVWYALSKDASFHQDFIAHATGKPTELAVEMGNSM
jgi:hypothetical protein